MFREISLSEARRQFSSLVHQIEDDPDIGYRILSRNRVVAELRGPHPDQGRSNAGAALLRAAEKINRSRPYAPRNRKQSVSEHCKEILYGRNGLLGPRERR